MIIINSRVLLEPKVLTLSLKSKPLVSQREEGFIPSSNVNFSLLQSGIAHIDKLEIQQQSQGAKTEFPAGFTEQVKL